MSYESETCEGCLWLMIRRRGAKTLNCCEEIGGTTPDPTDVCEHFVPSLECRKV